MDSTIHKDIEEVNAKISTLVTKLNSERTIQMKKKVLHKKTSEPTSKMNYFELFSSTADTECKFTKWNSSSRVVRESQQSSYQKMRTLHLRLLQDKNLKYVNDNVNINRKQRNVQLLHILLTRKLTNQSTAIILMRIKNYKFV